MAARPAADRRAGPAGGHRSTRPGPSATRRGAGHLAPGTLGDVTILSGDVTGGATPDEIRAMEVIATIVGGVPAYCADAAVSGREGLAPRNVPHRAGGRPSLPDWELRYPHREAA